MNDNLDIFISTHKDFITYPTNNTYKIITDKGINISVPLKIYYDGNTDIYPRNFNYAEGSRIYWTWKNIKLKKYIGFCHYRTYFDFEGDINNIPNMDELFSKYKIIATTPLNLKQSIESQYKNCHHIEDLMYIKNNHYNSGLPKEFEKHYLYTRNMFIMKKDDFLDYCNTVFPILLNFDKHFNLNTENDVMNLHKNETVSYGIKSLKYQSRIEGFLLERLTSAYISSRFNQDEIKTYNIKWTEYRIW